MRPLVVQWKPFCRCLSTDGHFFLRNFCWPFFRGVFHSLRPLRPIHQCCRPKVGPCPPQTIAFHLSRWKYLPVGSRQQQPPAFSRCPCWLVERILWNNSRRGIFEFWILVSFKKFNFKWKVRWTRRVVLREVGTVSDAKKKFFLKKKNRKQKFETANEPLSHWRFTTKKKGKLLETGNGGTTRKLRKRADSGPSELCKQVTSLVLSPLKIIAKMNGSPEMFYLRRNFCQFGHFFKKCSGWTNQRIWMKQLSVDIQHVWE